MFLDEVHDEVGGLFLIEERACGRKFTRRQEHLCVHPETQEGYFTRFRQEAVKQEVSEVVAFVPDQEVDFACPVVRVPSLDPEFEGFIVKSLVHGGSGLVGSEVAVVEQMPSPFKFLDFHLLSETTIAPDCSGAFDRC